MEHPNLDYLNEIADGQPEVVAQFVGIIAKEFPAEFEEYHALIDAKDSAKAAAMVHKLKHKISILGLVKSYEVAVNYENSLIDGSTRGKVDFESILQIMTDFLETL